MIFLWFYCLAQKAEIVKAPSCLSRYNDIFQVAALPSILHIQFDQAMTSKISFSEIREIYRKGGNIIEYLRTQNQGEASSESIMISYDLQAGSYTELAKKNALYIADYTAALSSVISGLGECRTIMEVGVGEATCMIPLMLHMDPENKLHKLGFDISWSRVRYAVQNSEQVGMEANLFVGDLFEIPLPSNSVDIIYTSHSLEPNGGKEKQALAELYRVTKKYIVLLEPDFKRASPEARERMKKHGYVRDLPSHAKELGYNVKIDEPFKLSVNPLNPTGLYVIEKNLTGTSFEPCFQCPVTHSTLRKAENVYFSESSGLIYPVINKIPCLLSGSAILGTHFSHFNKQ